MDNATCVTSEISEVILCDIVWITFHGNSGTYAVIASTESTILKTTK